MSSASEFVKIGGCLGFSTVFLLVLLKNRDIVSALMDASIACVIMALVFKQLHNYTSSLEKNAKESTVSEFSNHTDFEEDTHYESLTDDRVES